MKNLKKTLEKVARSLTVWIHIHVSKIRKIGPYDLVVLGSILVYGVVFSYFTVLKHNFFRSSAWDLGIFDQALYTTLQGHFLYYTPELFMVPSGSYFGGHFSPILLLVLPFYAIRPSATTLLVFQAFVLALGAIPLYLIALKTLEDKKAAVFFALLYLLYPPLQASNWFDFHTQIFLPLFLFSAYYFMQTKRWKFYFLSTLFVLMVEEHASILIFLMAVYFWIVSSPKNIVTSLRCRKMSQALVSLITIALSLAWFFFAQYIKRGVYINPWFIVRYKATGAFSVLGIEADPLLLPVYVLLNPLRVWDALMYDYPTKLFFVILLFGPLIFLPFKSKFSLVSLVLLVPSLLSNYLAYYTIGAQYPLYVVPLIFIALTIVVKQFHVGARISILKTALIVSMLFIVSLSPLSPISSTFIEKELVWYPILPSSFDEDTESLHNLLRLIPPESSVLTQNHIFPHVSARLHAYVIPPIGRFENDTEYLRGLINKSDYVLLDFWEWDSLTATVFDEIYPRNGSYTRAPYALGSKSLLFRKDYDGEPLFKEYVEHRVFAAYKDLGVASFVQVIRDLSVETGNVVLCPEGSTGIFVFGPFAYLFEGAYEVTFTIKVGEHDDSYVGTLDVSDDFGESIVSKRDIYGFELQSNEWINLTLSFTSTKFRNWLEYRAFSSGSADIYIDRVTVKRVSSIARSDFGLMTLAPGSIYLKPREHLLLEVGNITKEGFFVHQRNATSNVFWYGPYWSLSPGNYTVTFFLKTLPSPQKPDGKVITLQISADAGKTSIAEYDVYSSSFFDNEKISDWHEFTIALTVKDYLEQVEFRGLIPSPNYDIYLAFILVQQVW